MNEGDRVRTDQGDGTVVLIWTQLSIAYGVPKRSTYLTVELDGEPQWRRVYAPEDVTVIEEGVEFPA